MFKKFQSYEDMSFFDPKWPICPEQFFLVQTIIITFIYLLALFTVQNLKQFFQRIQNYEDAQFLGLKWPISPNENFFHKNLLISLVSFIHAYLHTKNQSQIIYWWNIDDWKILKSHRPRAFFGYNLSTRFFPSMQFSQNGHKP